MDEPSPDAAKPEGPPEPSDTADTSVVAKSNEPAPESEPRGARADSGAVAAVPTKSDEPPSTSEEPPTEAESELAPPSREPVVATSPKPAGIGVTFGRGSKMLLPIVLGIALLEAGAHLYQTRPVDERGDYERAAGYVREQITKDDGLVFWPDWSSRPGRFHFKEMATLEREGPTDDARYKRIFLVRNRGASGGGPAWNMAASRDFGTVRVDTLENPKPEPVLSNSLELFEQRQVEAFVHGPTEHRACPWLEDRGAAPPWDPATPPRRYQCENAGVGLLLALEHDYRPRYCLAAMPMAAPRALRLRFKGVRFGQKIVVHHLIHKAYENPDPRDAGPQFPPVDARYWVELPEQQMAEHPIGATVFRDGPGFAEVTFSTPELATKTGVLAVDISAASQSNRQYCFEVTTR